MHDYRERVIDERAELQIKIIKLKDFVFEGNPDFEVLSPGEKTMLKEQLGHMKSYSAVLTKRIAPWVL